MKSDLWRWAEPGGQQRRVRLDELRAALAGGLIAPNTPVWREGWPAWQPAHDVPELTTSALGAANGVVLNIPPPPLAVVAVQHEYEAHPGGSAPPVAEEEPPPPPHYVPAPVRQPSVPPMASTGSIPTIGLSARLSAAKRLSSIPAPAAQPVQPLPTELGLPPPPDLVALVAAAKAPSKPPPPDPALAPAPDAAPVAFSPAGAAGIDDPAMRSDLPPPTDPIHRERVPSMLDGAPPPPRPAVGLDALLSDLRAVRAGQPPQNKLLLIVAGVVSLSVLILVVGLLATVIRRPGTPPALSASTSSTPPRASVVSAASVTPPPSAVTTPSATAATTPPPPTGAACASAGDAKMVAARAVVPAGIETIPIAGGIGIGYALLPRDGVVITVDPGTAAITATARTKAIGADVKRVTPVLEKGKLAAVVDVDRKGDKLSGRRLVPIDPPIEIGLLDGGKAIGWTPRGKDSFAKIADLEGDGPVEALRTLPLATPKGVVVAYRRGASIYVFVATGEGILKVEGATGHVVGLGQVGAPALAVTGENVVMAWSDRKSADDPWTIRWTSFPFGQAPGEPRTLELPEGGLGSQAMSPALEGLGGGRFLVAWTEGPVSSHQVRARTFGVDGVAMGAPIEVSAPGVNAGQPQVAVGTDGRGVVAFLAAKGKVYEVQARPITCGARP